MNPREDKAPPVHPASADKTQPSPRVRKSDLGVAWPWWSVASLVMLGAMIVAGAGGGLAFALRTPPTAVWPTAVIVTVTPQPGPTYIVVTGAAPTPVVWPNITRFVQVTGTQGLSLRIRSAPGANAETVKLAPDGTRLLIIGEGQQADGALWWRVRDPSDGKEGWAVSTYLAPVPGP